MKPWGASVRIWLRRLDAGLRAWDGRLMGRWSLGNVVSAPSRWGRDALVAAASVLVIAMSVAAGPGGPMPFLAGPGGPIPQIADAWIDGPRLTLVYDAPLLGFRTPTQAEIVVRVNGERLAVTTIVADPGEQTVLVDLLGGAASLDSASLAIATGATDPTQRALGGIAETPLRVATPPWTLPEVRRNPRAVATPDAIYVMGGYQMTPEPAGDSIRLLYDGVRIDLVTGASATLRLGAYAWPFAWDPRPTRGCPTGCLRVLIFSEDPAIQPRFGHLDETSGSLVPEGQPLPRMPSNPSLAWTGSQAFVFFPYGPASVYRYDPMAQTTTAMRAAIPEAYNFTTLQAVWDPRPSLLCPGGCAYLLGGYGSGLGGPASSDSPRDEIWRYDPSLDVILPMRSRLPEAFNDVPVWIDDAAYQFFVPQGSGADTGPVRISRYDPAADAATTLGDIDAARELYVPVWLGDHGYLVGGHGSDGGRALVPFTLPG